MVEGKSMAALVGVGAVTSAVRSAGVLLVKPKEFLMSCFAVAEFGFNISGHM